jgi:hypothetical protein
VNVGGNKFLRDLFAAGHFRAQWIHAHPDYRIPWQFPDETDVSSDDTHLWFAQQPGNDRKCEQQHN